MFERVKQWWSLAWSSGPEHPLESLIRKQEQWNFAQSRVKVQCETCKFVSGGTLCRRFPQHVGVEPGGWCGEYRVSDAAVRAFLPPTELAP